MIKMSGFNLTRVTKLIAIFVLTGLLSGCAYPEIIESARQSSRLPTASMIPPTSFDDELGKRFSIGSDFSDAIDSLMRDGFEIVSIANAKYLRESNLDYSVVLRRFFRKGLNKYTYSIHLESSEGKITNVSGSILKHPFWNFIS